MKDLLERILTKEEMDQLARPNKNNFRHVINNIGQVIVISDFIEDNKTSDEYKMALSDYINILRSDPELYQREINTNEGAFGNLVEYVNSLKNGTL